jgi:hypothetical protein
MIRLSPETTKRQGLMKRTSDYNKRLAFKIQGLRRSSDGLSFVPSYSRIGAFHRVDTQALTCTCPGFSIAKRNGGFCVDVVAALNAIAGQVLEITGTPDAEALIDACEQIGAGGGWLRERAMFNGDRAAKYGYTPDGRWHHEWSIGLRESARGGLSKSQINACAFVLSELVAQITATAEAA